MPKHGRQTTPDPGFTPSERRLVDRQGNLVQTYTGNQWTPEQVVSDVKVMVGVD